MYGLYDGEGVLRFINSDKDACLAYAELFDIKSTKYSLMRMMENKEINKKKKSNQSLEENNN